ncbi:hypothetical protein [Streptomyces sp. NPDC059411]|uniref:hypothetical protein n=1 Tax=Streptomyces sp. NPDC059411 TaxID=3346825 RepID=UPI0036CCC755
MTGPAAKNTDRRGPEGRTPPGAAARTAPPVSPPAPWVRTRLRATPLATLLGAALAFVAVLLAAALPRAEDRGSDQALRSFLESRGPSSTSLLVTSQPRFGNQTGKDLDEVLATLVARTGPRIRVAADGPVHGTTTDVRSLGNPELTRPTRVAPTLALYHLREATDHVRLVEGRWPGAPAAGGPIPIALSQSAARSINARLGMVLEGLGRGAGTLRAEVVGLYAANDEADAYWTDLGCVTHACLTQTATIPPEPYWRATGLVGEESLDRLGEWAPGAQDFWRIPADTGVLRSDQLPATAKEVASYVAGPTSARLKEETHRGDLRFSSTLPELFKQARARQQAAAPLAAIGPAGGARGGGGGRRAAPPRGLAAPGGPAAVAGAAALLDAGPGDRLALDHRGLVRLVPARHGGRRRVRGRRGVRPGRGLVGRLVTSVRPALAVVLVRVLAFAAEVLGHGYDCVRGS